MSSSIGFFEFLAIVVKLGALAYLVGIIFQILMVINYHKPWTWGELTFLLILTRVVSIGLTILIWKYWPFNINIMQGLILVPSLIAEIIASPLSLWIFKHGIFGKPTKYV
jgi:hypothetical protein